MAVKNTFVCQACGAEFSKWMGQCGECGQWNAVSEQVPLNLAQVSNNHAEALKTMPITDVYDAECSRQSCGINELDRVLGGGLVAGSAILIGGDPGIGKSTLLLQAGCQLATEIDTLYITGEESPQQVKLRGSRISSLHDNLHIAAGTSLQAILATITKSKPAVVIIDSIQTVSTDRLSSAAGTVAQVRECASALIQSAKQMGHALILVGHVTKDGAIAGPRVLEHMVDAVLYFEGDKGHAYRILRAVKNRFGPAGEIGIFEMSDKGLIGVRDASRLFLSERDKNTPGSVVLACMEGTRPLLVEVQALVAPTVYATPKRSAVGLDVGRVSMLTAVLERRIGVPLDRQDVYVNVVGGAKIIEPAADLAILLAIISSFRERPMQEETAIFGEIGLTGEVRAVGRAELRAREAAALGFKRIILPHENHARVQETNLPASIGGDSSALVSLPVRQLAEAVQAGLT
ncbi:MAG: DNA repair protein RadA [Mariprofundaceae bacterium]